MKRFIIIVLLMLLLLILAVFLMPAAEGEAKEVPDDFGERIENMIREHKIMTERLIAAWEHQREEINLLAEVIYHENWHTDKEHLAAYYTGAVVMNRVRSGAWPDTVKAVLYQKGQYSTTKYFYTKELPAEVYDMARDIYKNGTPDVPENVIFQAMRPLGKTWKKVNTDYFCYG
ncbi:MAG: cell wall hydrolase [Bacteroidales bacterium]|nr:cell wall hydrolase [Bacteroidales bacterium]